VLRLSGPDDCDDAARLFAAMDAQPGAELPTDTQLEARASVVAHSTEDYELTLDYRTASGTADHRVVRGESCKTVTDAAALVLALALNPSPPPPPPAASAPARESTPASAGKSSFGFEVALLGLVDTAALSVPGVGAGLRLAGALGPLRLMVSAQGFLPREVEHNSVTTRLQLLSIAAGACYLVGLGTRSVLGPCVQFEMGPLRAESRGKVEGATAESSRLQALTLSAEFRLQLLASLWLAINAGLEWISRRPDFVVTDVGTVVGPSLLGARIAFGPLFAW
jgi:hypothetical protein